MTQQVDFPSGYYVTRSGQFEYMERAIEQMKVVIPVTLLSSMAGLLPIMWGTGTGSEVMSRIAAPMVGAMISSTVLTLTVIPAIYALVKQRRLTRRLEA